MPGKHLFGKNFKRPETAFLKAEIIDSMVII
jgi:hypothetical protein